MPEYFTKDTDEYIKQYIEAKSDEERHAIFEQGIKAPFEKLIESLIHVYGFYNIDEIETLKKDCLANMYEMITKFDPAKGSKGFSYFNVVCKNWFIQKHREKKKGKIQSSLQYDLTHDSIVNSVNYSVQPHEDEVIEKEFWIAFYENMDCWRDHLKKKSEKQVLEAIIFLMRNPNFITIYNKKAIYLYLRELTGLNTKQVVINLKKIKSLYLKFKNKFDSDKEQQQGDQRK